MRLSSTLSVYIGRQFLMNFLGLLGVILLIVLLFDTIEILRRTHSRHNVTFDIIIQLAMLKLPYMGQQIFPFAALFGGMLTFWRLARHQELIVTRAAGISAWQFLLPVISVGFLLGVFQTTALNHLASITLSNYERSEALLFKGGRNLLEIGKSGVWLRQSNPQGQAVIKASRIITEGKSVTLFGITVFLFKGNDQFHQRFDASTASLEDGFWHIKKARIQTPEETSIAEETMWLETDLTFDSIQDSFASPETMSFWSLPSFVSQLEEAGFSAVRHRLYLHSLLSAPLLMCAMVLISATFTLRHGRRGSTVFVITGGVLTGFVLYFFTDIVFALGQTDTIPVILAAWTPSGVATLLGLTTLLHLEDG